MPEAAPDSDNNWKGLQSLNYLSRPPVVSAQLKQNFSDFRVSEELGFDLSNFGEHLYLQVKKTDLSTTDVAKRLASATRQKVAAVGYAGMKDKRAESTQWFSVPLDSSEEGLLEGLEKGNVQVLSTQRNKRKLKIGSHKLNHFEITLRDCKGSHREFEENLQRILTLGVPNYFGEQRFGRGLSNLHQFHEILQQDSPRSRINKKRFKRSMVISAARAYVFNQVVSARIGSETWDKYLPGDVLNLNGTDRCFLPGQETWDETLEQRLRSFDIHITGPLPGINEPKDKYVSSGEAADMEEAVLQEFSFIPDSLRQLGINAARRPLRFMPENLKWSWLDDRTLKLDFALRRGAYATSLLREVCITEQELKEQVQD